MATWKAEACGASTDFEQFAHDAKDFEVLVPRDLAHAADRRFPVFGCAAEPRNACRATLAKDGKLRRFERMQVAWVKWFRSNPKAEAQSGDLLICVRPCGLHGKSFWLLMTDAVFSPIVQTFAVCCPTGMQLDSDGSCMASEQAPPFEVEIRSKSSQLARCGIGSMKSVWHMTSDELLVRLSESAEVSWEVVKVQYEDQVDSPSLRFLTVTGMCTASDLQTIVKGKVASEDPFFDWLRLSAPRGKATKASASSGGHRLGDHGSGVPGAAPLGAPTPVGEEVPVADWVDEEEDVDADACDDLEELLADLLEEFDLEEEEDDATVLGCAEQGDADDKDTKPSGDALGTAGIEEDPAPPEPSSEVIAVVESVAKSMSPAVVAPTTGSSSVEGCCVFLGCPRVSSMWLRDVRVGLRSVQPPRP